jgi:hypothetical protein
MEHIADVPPFVLLYKIYKATHLAASHSLSVFYIIAITTNAVHLSHDLRLTSSLLHHTTL